VLAGNCCCSSCGSDFSRDALALICCFEVQSVSSSCGGRVTFLLCGQEKSNQKRRPPRVALSGHPAQKVREVRPGFSTAHPCAGEKESTSMSIPPSGPVDPTSPPHRGPRLERARVLRALFRKAKGRIKSRAGPKPQLAIRRASELPEYPSTSLRYAQDERFIRGVCWLNQ
jgi:hypothetical protein